MPGPGPSPALDLATDLVSLLQTRESAPPPVAQLSKLHALLAAEASTSAPSQLPFGELVARSRVCLLPLTLVLMDHALLGAPRGLQAHELAAACCKMRRLSPSRFVFRGDVLEASETHISFARALLANGRTHNPSIQPDAARPARLR